MPGYWLCSSHMESAQGSGRNFYSGPRDFGSISLTSFLLKTMERKVDRFLIDETLA
jgi:hypothetical protein